MKVEARGETLVRPDVMGIGAGVVTTVEPGETPVSVQVWIDYATVPG